VNFFEHAIGAVSPGWALRRAQARAVWREIRTLEARQLGRAYDAAKTGRRAANWVAGSTSANAEIAPALSRIRNRSREMVRNNPYARSAITKLVARAVGTGIMARPPKQVLPLWTEFVEQADFEGQHDLYGLESLIARTVFESGECLVRRIRTRNARMPLQVQVLEPDYLDDTKFGPLAGGNFAIGGIEVDAQGRRVAYWIYDHHPGELVQLPKSWASRRVDVGEILHVYEKERPGQLRGPPRLAVSMLRLRDVDEYQDAQMMRKKIEACFAAFVNSPADSRPLAEPGATETDADGRRIETLSPGMIWYGKSGEEVTFGMPSGVARDEYTNDQLHAIAAGCGITYEQLTGDYSQVTYLSARSAQLEFRELIEMFRWVHFIPMACRGIWRWFLDAGYTAGRLRTDTYQVGWTPPRWQWIDPSKDTTAAKEEVRGGLSSLSEKLREMGMDPDEVFAEFAAERAKMKALGLVFDTDAGAVPKAGGTAAPVVDKDPAPAADPDAADDPVADE